jgi:hypothetical protein
MANKEKTATVKLGLALAGIDAALIVMKETDDRAKVADLIARAREYTEQARDHLMTIQFHLSIL